MIEKAPSAPPTSLQRAPFVEAADVRRDALLDSYRKLAEMYHVLLAELSLDAVLGRIAVSIGELVPYDSLTIYQADEVRRELVAILTRSDWQEEVLRTRPRYGQGITGWAAEHREPVLTNAAHLDPRVSFIPGTPPDPEALIVVPLVARGSLKGLLNIYRLGEQARFVDDEFELAKRFGDAAALAFDNAQIRATLEHQAQTDSLTGLHNDRFFHDRLRVELNRASLGRDTVALLVFDVDDFRRINDVHGQGVGDQVLGALAERITTTVRPSDVVCRLGGVKFAVIMPSASTEDAFDLGCRLRDVLTTTEFEIVGRLSVSIGIAQGPENASNPRALLGCADVAMLTAKARGKNQVVLFGDAAETELPSDEPDPSQASSMAHLKLLQTLAPKLNRLNGVHEIGMTIANELRVLVDYHSCAVYLRDGDDLMPIAFRGDGCPTCEHDARSLDAKVGEGPAGRTAESGETHLASTDSGETIAAVPFMSGSRAIGVLVITHPEKSQTDRVDLRLLEVLAAYASVSLEKARMYERQRQQAARATELLAYADRLLASDSPEAVGLETVRTVSRLLGVPVVSLWLEDPGSGRTRCIAHIGEHSAAKTEEVVAPLSGLGGWISVRPPEDRPVHLNGARMALLDELVERASIALR